MKKLCFLLLTIMMPMVANADAVNIDGIYYNLDANTKCADVTCGPFICYDVLGQFEVPEKGYYKGDIVIPEYIIYEGVKYRVTSINGGRNYSFSYRGEYNYYYTGAFGYCEDLTSITIPNSVTSIGDYAFFNCTGLTSITIPDGVTSIGGNTFRRCSGLTSIVIPNSVTGIGERSFEGCSSLTSVTIPNSVTSLGERAFSGCSGLTSPVYNSTLFAYLPTSYSGSYNIPEGIKEICSGAFSGCSGLTSITIPNSVTSIGSDAFSGCKSLSTVHISDLAAWCNIQFDDPWSSNPLSIAHHLYLNGEEVKELVIPDDMTSICSFAFFGYSSLTSVTIPNSVTSIGMGAFYNCSNLMDVMVKTRTPINIFDAFSNEALHGYNYATLYVPYGCKAAYENAEGWKDFKEIVEMDDSRSEQTLALTEIPTFTYGDAPYILPQKTEEGLTLTWSVDNGNVSGWGLSEWGWQSGVGNNAVARVNGNTLTIVGAGTATVTATQAGNENYHPFLQEFTLTVNKALLTITANDCTKQEGEETPVLTVSYSGFKNNDSALSLATQPTATTTATTASPAGSYPITVSGAASNNYIFDYVNGTLTVVEKSGTLEPTDISQLTNAIYIEPFEGRVGDDINIEVRLKNAASATSYGFELVLPQGISIAVDSDGSFDDEVTLSTRHKGHTTTTNKLSDTTYKIGVASMSSKVLTDNDGVAITIKAHVSADMAVGEYPIMVKNPLIVNNDGTKPNVQETLSKITIEDYVKGDVDGDGVIDLADAVLVINHYVGKPVASFIDKAADVDGDGVIDLADAVLIINYYVGKIPSLARSMEDDGLEPQ